MEKIIDYKVKDFLELEDFDKVQEYITILDHLKPLNEIPNPSYKWYHKWFKKRPKTLIVNDIRSLKFHQVFEIKMNLFESNIQSLIDSIKMIVDVQDNDILNFTITTFYGIISKMKLEIIEIIENEIKDWFDDFEDEFINAVNANERMAIFGVLNLLDSLANGDVLKWEEIEKLPYQTVFVKLKMDKEKNKIQREIAELQRKKQVKK